jgi:hypothetical protein
LLALNPLDDRITIRYFLPMGSLKDRVIESFASEAGVPYNACCGAAFCLALVTSHYYTVWEHPHLFAYFSVKLMAVVTMAVPVFGLSIMARGHLRRKAWANFQADEGVGAEIIPFTTLPQSRRSVK